MKAQAAILAGLCIFSADLWAIEPTQCIVLDKAGGGTAVRNRCDARLSVIVCAMQKGHWWSCEGGGGLLSLAPGASYPVLDLKGQVEINWAACVEPQSPRDWDPLGSGTFRCR